MMDDKNIKKREKRRANHLCLRCGKPLPDGDSHANCPECRAKIKQDNKERYEARRAAGECVYCGRPARLNSYSCFACAVKKSGRNRERYMKKDGGGSE